MIIVINKDTIATTFGYIGACFMMVFAFTLNPVQAIIGLIGMTVQSINNRLWNLVVLNVVSVIGFITQLI